MTADPKRRPIETVYRGRTYRAEWYVEDNHVHLVSDHGERSCHIACGSPKSMPLPSELAEGMLWDLLRERDPKRPLFYWEGPSGPHRQHGGVPIPGPMPVAQILGLLVLGIVLLLLLTKAPWAG